jgi:hypothetical protein
MNSYIFANEGLAIPDELLELAKSLLTELNVEGIDCSGSDLRRLS